MLAFINRNKYIGIWAERDRSDILTIFERKGIGFITVKSQ